MLTGFKLPHRLAIALAASTLLGLAACSDQRTGPQSLPLTAAQADSLSEVIVADAQAELDAVTANGGTGFIPGASALGLVTSPLLPCQPTIEPAGPLNSDQDRVRDSVRITFPSCVFTVRSGSDTVRGVIDVIDPTPKVTDRAIKQVFTDFARIAVDRNGHAASVTLNGSRQAIRDSAQISQQEISFHTNYVFRDGSTASHVRDWDMRFVADQAGAIQTDRPLPSGALTLNGSSTFTRGDQSIALGVTTPAPLHRDATCLDRPSFDTGTLVLVATKNGATTTVIITFTACGTYTVTKS